MARYDRIYYDAEYYDEGLKVGATIVQFKNLVIHDVLTKEANTASFEMYGSYSAKPIEGQEVIFTKDGIKLFHGRIVQITSEKLNADNFIFIIDCTDWQVDLDKKLIVQTYKNQTLYDIIDDINTNYLTGFTINNVENPGPTIDRIQFNYQYVSECFQEIAEVIGYDWYVDYDKDIHFFPFEENDAPYEIDDNNTNFDELKIEPDNTQLANRIWIRGGWYQSDQYTQDTIIATAGQTEFYIIYKPHDLSVTVDAVSKTVGIENIDNPGTYDFLLNVNEKLLKVDQISFSGGEAVIMKYDYEIPILAMVEDTVSQINIASIEGGDGIYEKYITDQKIQSLDQARERGNAELNKYANPLVSGSFISYQNGWRTGQRVHINLTDRNIDEYYLIREVNIEIINKNQLRYTLTFATFLQGFNWLLIQILDGLKPKIDRSDEILDQLMHIEDTINDLQEDSTTITLQIPPFEYGPGGNPQGIYNEAQYS